MKPVRFHYLDRKLKIKNKLAVQSFLPTLFQEAGKTLHSLTYVFCSDGHLLSMNKQFLQHDYYTDILTFDLSERSEVVVAEIYISIDRVQDNALLHQSTFYEETLRVIFHGALHLCGYKDKSKKDQYIMRSKENYYIQRFTANVSRET